MHIPPSWPAGGVSRRIPPLFHESLQVAENTGMAVHRILCTDALFSRVGEHWPLDARFLLGFRVTLQVRCFAAFRVGPGFGRQPAGWLYKLDFLKQAASTHESVHKSTYMNRLRKRSYGMSTWPSVLLYRFTQTSGPFPTNLAC